MTMEAVSGVLRDTLLTTLIVAGPMMAISLVIGLTISVLQAATQINEQTLTFIPKLVGVLGLFGILFPWLMTEIIGLASRLMEIAAQQGGP